MYKFHENVFNRSLKPDLVMAFNGGLDRYYYYTYNIIYIYL